jgi:hypothetical protein
MRVLAVITKPAIAKRILECMGLPQRAPPLKEASTPGFTADPWQGEPAVADFDQTPPGDWDSGA